MKCLVISDTHGNSARLGEILAAERDAEVLFFLGDGVRDLEAALTEELNLTVLPVKGNCDIQSSFRSSPLAKTDEVDLLGRRIVFTHGDLYAVKFGTSRLAELARERRADVVLYGHTHHPAEDFVGVDGRGVYLFNPGAVAGSWDALPSWGVLTLTESSVSFSVKRLPER